jgi:hypothetical protein
MTALDYSMFAAKAFSMATGELVGIQSSQPLGKLWAVGTSIALLAAAYRRTNDTQTGKIVIVIAGMLVVGVLYLILTDYFGAGGTTGGAIIAGNMPLPSTAWRAFALTAAVPLVVSLAGAWWLSRPSANIAQISHTEASP